MKVGKRAMRRHKKKGKTWIKKRYWSRIGNDNWVFFDSSMKFSRTNQRLMKCSNTKIIRHIKVLSDKNPFIDYEYFRQRSFSNGCRNLTGDFKHIWITQSGICPYCLQSINIGNPEDREIHHRIPKAWGGEDKPSNLIYMHKICHIEYHKTNRIQGNFEVNKKNYIILDYPKKQ